MGLCMMCDLPGYLSKDITGLREESVTHAAKSLEGQGVGFGECVAVTTEKYDSRARTIGDEPVRSERVAGQRCRRLKGRRARSTEPQRIAVAWVLKTGL